MSEINGQFSDDRTVEIISDESPNSNSKTSPLNERIAVLEQENRQLIDEKSAIEKSIVELTQSITESTTENSNLKNELSDLKSEIKTLGSVAARASELEGEVSRLQHDLISVSTELDEANRELSDAKVRVDVLRKEEEVRGKEIEAVVAERDLLIEKLQKMEAKEEEYITGGHEKEKLIGNLRGKIEELMVAVGKSADDKNYVSVLKARVVELEKKLEDREKLINGFEMKEREMENVVVEGKSGGVMIGDVRLGWNVVAGSVVCGVGLSGLVCYLKAKRN